MNAIFKMSAISLAILGFTASAHAYTLTGAFVGIEALNLQPRVGDLDYITVIPPTTNGSFVTTGMHPSYAWNFRLYGGFRFCGNEDLTVSWLRLHSDYSSSLATPFGTGYPGIPGISIPRWLDTDTWAGIGSHVTFKLDEVYGVFGHTFNGNIWSVRVAGGVEWAKFVSDMTVFATALTLPLQPADTLLGYKAKSKIQGAGPRIEGDMIYHTPFGVGVYAKSNAALLISSRQVELLGQDAALNNLTFTKRYVVIPKFGLRLGLNFMYEFGQVGGEGVASNGTVVAIDAGWVVESYIHALERPQGFGNLGTNEFAQANLSTKTANFAYQGLFVGVTIGTDWV